MFYDNFERICKENGKSVYAVCNDLGITPSTPSSWRKKGNTPNGDVLLLIANYFNISVDYLLGNNDSISEDDELNEYLDELRNRSEMRMLFSVSKGATKEEVEQAVKIIEALRKND